MQIDYPYTFDSRGRTAETTEEEHIRDLIEQVLFTTPGERVNRPTFGSGLLQLVFAPNGGALGAATQMAVQGTLFVHFLKKNGLTALTKNNVVISGGERIRGVRVVSVSAGTNANDHILTVGVDRPGDYSTYTLRLVKDALHAAEGGEPPDGF